MRRAGLCALGIGVFLSAGPLTGERGYADDNDDATTCTLATLKGRYLFALERNRSPVTPPVGLSGRHSRVFAGA